LAADNAAVHGLWVWKNAPVLQTPRAGETFRDFCHSRGIDEVYLSVASEPLESRLARLIAILHRSGVRVEALLSTQDADLPGKHREKLLADVGKIIQFNRTHPGDRFDGIHLDIEPQQRAENKGVGNLKFLPGLVDAYRELRARAERNGLTVNADIQTKLLKGNLAQRTMLLSALPRLTLMLYELNRPGDGDSVEKKIEKLRSESRDYLDLAYAGISEANLAQMVIALRTPDYGDLLPEMLRSLEEANATDPHYLGWALHSYNDFPGAGR
jgi:hypothetical protein